MTETHPIGTGERLKRLEDALFDLAVAACNLAVATDGMEQIRPQRQALLQEVERAEVTLRKDEDERA